MADKRQGYLQKAKRQMKKKGTIGAFTDYCGGKVTDQCIERAMNSNNDTLRRRAQFAKNMRNMKTGGEVEQETAKKLPGGVMQPIGYGAFKFHGNKHDEAGMGSDSGIILEEGGKKEPGLEVEDGELQVDVNTAEGEKEYIVSDYLINPATGNTIAEDLEEALESVDSQEEADEVNAKYVALNEKIKGAGSSDRKKAQEGRFDDLPGEYEGGALTAEEANIGKQKGTDAGLYGDATLENLRETRASNPWFDWDNFDPTSKEDVKKFQEEYNERAPEDEKLKVDGKFGTQTQSASLFKSVGELPAKEADIPSAAPEQKLQGEKKEVQTTTPSDKPDKVKGKGIPVAGTFLQGLGDAAGLLKNYDVTARTMAPAYAKEIRMGRTNLDPERAAAREQSQATSSGISTGLAGPAAFAMQQKNLAGSQQGQRAITDQETRSNIGIADREKSINAGIRQSNQKASMTAGQFNATQQSKADLTNRANKMYKTSLAQNIGDTAAQQYADQQQIRGDIFKSQASQVDGEFDRAYEAYGPNKNMFKRSINLQPEGGTTYSPEQVSESYQQFLKQQQQPAEKTKKGGYTKRSNKVRRRKKSKR